MVNSQHGKIIGDLLAQHFSNELSALAGEILQEDRPLLALLAAQALREAGIVGGGSGVERPSGQSAATPWEKITSLSQLRALVGGRFQQLKERWIGAGFPLREHRGDRSQKAEVDEQGWLELSAWISRQGFEARRDPSLIDELFAVRPSGSK